MIELSTSSPLYIRKRSGFVIFLENTVIDLLCSCLTDSVKFLCKVF